jgi:hypothetical protein
VAARHKTAVAVLAACLVALTAFAVTPSTAGESQSCAQNGYSYAGVVGSAPASGVSALLTAATQPEVRTGHVAAWVGIGGRRAGPDGSDVWLQAGLVSYPRSGSRLYYELMLPNGRRYVELARDVPAGRRVHLAVSESARAGAWQVLVDGRSVTDAIDLPGSHASWPAIATAESWARGRQACNSYAFGFASPSERGLDGIWRPLPRGRVLQTSATAVVTHESRSGFAAVTR